MSKFWRIPAVLTVGGLLLTSLFAPAHALSVIAPAAGQAPKSETALTAFTPAENKGGTQDDLLLSPSEVRHVQWCAARYPSYQPTDDTFAASGGRRMACRSPH